MAESLADPTGVVALDAQATVAEPDAIERVHLARLVHGWLRPDARWASRQELPFLLGQDPRTHTRVVRDGAGLAAHAALHARPLRFGGRELALGIMGAVATRPDARGRGHAASLTTALQEVAREEGLDLVLLWDEHGGSLYPRAGFVEVGVEAVFTAPRSAFFRAHQAFRFRRLDESRDLDAVMRLYAREPGGLVRTSDDFRRLARLPGCDHYVLLDGPSSTVCAYGVIGKGSDLVSCLHEWCGPTQLLPDLLAHVFRRRSEDQLHVMSPPWRVAELEQVLQTRAIGCTPGALGMVWAPDAPGLLSSLGVSVEDPADAESVLGTLIRTFGWRDRPISDEGAPGLYVFGLDSM